MFHDPLHIALGPSQRGRSNAKSGAMLNCHWLLEILYYHDGVQNYVLMWIEHEICCSPTGGHTPLCFVTTCDNEVFNGGVFMHFSIIFAALFVDRKLL